MFERLKKLFSEKRIGQDDLRKAVDRGWISEAQFYDIVGEKLEVIKREEELATKEAEENE